MCRAHEVVLFPCLDNAFIMLEGKVSDVRNFLLLLFQGFIARDPVEQIPSSVPSLHTPT